MTVLPLGACIGKLGLFGGCLNIVVDHVNQDRSAVYALLFKYVVDTLKTTPDCLLLAFVQHLSRLRIDLTNRATITFKGHRHEHILDARKQRAVLIYVI